MSDLKKSESDLPDQVNILGANVEDVGQIGENLGDYAKIEEDIEKRLTSKVISSLFEEAITDLAQDAKLD